MLAICRKCKCDAENGNEQLERNAKTTIHFAIDKNIELKIKMFAFVVYSVNRFQLNEVNFHRVSIALVSITDLQQTIAKFITFDFPRYPSRYFQQINKTTEQTFKL